MLTAWLWLGRRVVDRTATTYTMVATTGFWLTPLLLSVPVFSRDTYSYLAQGALLRDGFDPYVVGPIENPNPLLDDVSPIWTTTTAPYGPVFILVAKFVTLIVGDHVIAGHHAAAAVHAARAGDADLGGAADRPARGRQRPCRTVDLRPQPAGDHPSDGWRPQRDADGRPDDRGHRPHPAEPTGLGRRSDRDRGRGEGDRGHRAALHGLDVDAPVARRARTGRRRGRSRSRRRRRPSSSSSSSRSSPRSPASASAGSPHSRAR